MSEQATVDILPVLQPIWSEVLKTAVQTPGRSIAVANESDKKPVNDLGYRFSIQVGLNAAHGGMNSGGVMLAGNGDRYIQLCISSVVSNGARAWDGGVIRNSQDPKYRGNSLTKQVMQDADFHATEHNKNLCYGGALYSRGVVSSISVSGGITTVTFSSTQGGSYFLKETESGSASKVNMRYFFHHPTTYAIHGDSGGSFPLIDVPSRTTARFLGDLSATVTVAPGDIVVPAGTADGISSINKGITSFEKMCGDSGDYFTANRDAEDKIRGIRHDMDGDPVDRATLQYMDDLYAFKWPQDEAGTANHIDFISYTQDSRMLFAAEGIWRLDDASYKKFDPKNEFAGWGRRRKVKDVHILGGNWFIIQKADFCHYEQVPYGMWDYDGLKDRTIPSNGSIRDAKQRHYIGVDQYAHEFPGKNMQLFNASTSGTATQVST